MIVKLPNAKIVTFKSEQTIDHVTQQPKETCQRTCRGPLFPVKKHTVKLQVLTCVTNSKIYFLPKGHSA